MLLRNARKAALVTSLAVLFFFTVDRVNEFVRNACEDLSGLWVASASVNGPVSVTFVVRRGSAERSLGSAALRLRSGAGSLLVLVIGGAGGTQDVRLTLTGTT